MGDNRENTHSPRGVVHSCNRGSSVVGRTASRPAARYRSHRIGRRYEHAEVQRLVESRKRNCDQVSEYGQDALLGHDVGRQRGRPRDRHDRIPQLGFHGGVDGENGSIARVPTVAEGCAGIGNQAGIHICRYGAESLTDLVTCPPAYGTAHQAGHEPA